MAEAFGSDTIREAKAIMIDTVGELRQLSNDLQVGPIEHVLKFKHPAILANAATEIVELREEVERLQSLSRRAVAIIADAICHGMPITREVADVRNQILGSSR